MRPLVSILIPNYKTPALTKLCLRLIRKHTDTNKVKVIVIDNDSQDASLEYLRTLSWIHLIERQAITGETPVQAHARALDLALAGVTTPYVLSIHTDTLVKRGDWLTYLLSKIEKSPVIAGVGSWKLELKPWWRRHLKWIENKIQFVYWRILGKSTDRIEGMGNNFYYLRSHCALYRTDLLKKMNLHFADGDMVAGKEMHKQLVDAGYKMLFLSSDILGQYIEHINHATTVLNPKLSTREKSITKGLKRVEASLKKLNAEGILSDASLDETKGLS